MGLFQKIKLIFSSTLLFISFFAVAQGTDYDKQIDDEQLAFDAYDGTVDSIVRLRTNSLTARANATYFTAVDRIQQFITDSISPLAKQKRYRKHVVKILEKIDYRKYDFIYRYEQVIRLVEEMVKPEYEGQMNKAKNKLTYAFYTLKFVNEKSDAKDFYIFASGKQPLEVLRNYRDWSYLSYSDEILSEVARNDPNAVKQYFGTSHSLYRKAKASQDPILVKMLEIYRNYGTRSASYTNLQWIMEGMTLEESEALIKDKKKYFKKLQELRTRDEILSPYSVDETLHQLSLKKVKKINDLHETTNENVRFAAVARSDAREIYTLMVYTPEEIYTSSFLGMYKRMMAKRKVHSGYKFLESMGFNRFRIFIRQCTGYNTLQSFLNTMTEEEIDAFIEKTVSNLENTGGNLEPAVDVANIYGSLKDPKLRKIFKVKFEDELMRNVYKNNLHGMKIYGLLYKLSGENPEIVTGGKVKFDVPNLQTLSIDELFPDGKNIQHHFFFDDDDGYASYASFVAGYRNGNWKIVDKGNYIIIKSIKGRKVEIYCNKPKREYEGQPELNKMFDTKGRYPDVIVHRGHSYYIDSCLVSMTPSTKVAVLGSCGGYHNISKAMQNAEEVQIISSKQIGTMRVNNALLKEMNETLRKGNDLVWDELWKRISSRLGGDPKFKEYIPPHRNLGAVFIRSYNNISSGSL
jgi:hypothetical protein